MSWVDLCVWIYAARRSIINSFLLHRSLCCGPNVSGIFPLCAQLPSQKLKATLSQQLPQVTNGDGVEVQSNAVTHTAAPASPAPTPTPAPTAVLTPAPAPHLPSTEEPSPHSLQQPATSTTETPVRIHTYIRSGTGFGLQVIRIYYIHTILCYSFFPVNWLIVTNILLAMLLAVFLPYFEYRLPQCRPCKTLQAQEAGGAEPQAKTPMRRGASSWSGTGLPLLAVGRRGRCGSSRWRRKPRTSTPWMDNYRCYLPPNLESLHVTAATDSLSRCVHPGACLPLHAVDVSVYADFFPSVVMKSLKPIKKSCCVTAAVCEPFTSICPCQ